MQILKSEHYNTPFIVVTGSINEETAAGCIKAGAQDYVLKDHITRIVPASIAAVNAAQTCIENEKALEEKRKADESSKFLLEHAGVPILTVDENGIIVSINNTAAAYIRAKPESLEGKSITELMLSEYAKKALVRIRESIKNGKGYETEQKVNFFGVERLFSSNVRPIALDSHPVPCVLVVSRDITEKSKIDEALRESEERYRKLVEVSPEAIAIHSDGKVMFVNNAGVKLIGANNPDQVIGRNVLDFVHQDSKDDVKQRIRKMYEEKSMVPLSIEKFVKLDGTPIDVETSAVYFTFRNKPSVQLMFRDITDMKKTEEALRMNYKVQTIVNTLLHVSLEDISLEEILDKVLENLLTMPCVGLEPRGAIYLAENGLPRLSLKAEKNFPKGFKTDAASIDFQSDLCKEALRSGEMEFIEQDIEGFDSSFCKSPARMLCCVPVKYAEKILGVIVLCLKDGKSCEKKSFEFLNTVAQVIAGIIRRKQAENEKALYQQHLAETGRLTALGEMAAGVAHELNNPMTIIMGNAQYLLKKKLLEGETKEIIEEVNEASARCRDIIAGLLGFARQHEMKLKDYSLKDLIDEALHLRENEIQLKKITIKRDYSALISSVHVSYTHIEQVIANIIANALEAMEPGGELSIKTCLSNDRNYAEASFSDTGQGISPENITRIFEPFFSTKQKGTGLGLAISYGVVKQHGGNIRVASHGSGKGATFTVSLPVQIGTRAS